MEQRKGSARPRHNMAMEDPDLWVLEFGLFHELDQVAAQIKEKRNLTRAQIEASPLFRRMKLNSLSGTLANERKYPEWDKWLTVFANCCPDDWDSGPDSPHHALLNEYKAQLVLQPLLGESPDINAFLARRKTYLPFTSSATPGEAALAKEMADLAQLLKARSAKPADIRRAINAAAADHPIDTFKRDILAFITRVKHCSPRPFLYQVYDDITTGRYIPSAKSKPFTEEELREAYGDDEGWKAIVNQTDPDVENFAGRGQRASSSRTGGGALVRADAETEDQQKKAKATTETRDGPKAKTATALAQTAKGKRKQRDEEEAEDEGEEEEEAEKPKAKGKEAKKREESSKRALSPVRDLRAKSQVLREQAKKHDPLPGLLARKPTTAAAAPAAPVFEGRDDYGDEAEAEAHESADEGEKAKQTAASAKRQYNERHPSATRLHWDSEDESPLKTRDQQEVIREARATVRRRKLISESESDNEREAEDEDDGGKKKRATKKVKRDPYEFKVPGERARLAGGRRKKRFWTDDEIELLLEGVRTHGLGCWAKILSDYEFAPGRTSVDLKDKYRNLLKLQAKEQEAYRAKRAAAASKEAKVRGRQQQPPPSKKSKKGDGDGEEEEAERSEEEDDSTTTVGSQDRREEAEGEENAADRRKEKERSEKEEEREEEEDEEEAEEPEEVVEDKKSKKAAAGAQSPRVGSRSRSTSTTQTTAVAQSPRVGGSTTQAAAAVVAQSPRVLSSTSTSTSTQAAAAQRKQQLAAKRREDEDYDENELIIDDEGEEDDEVVAQVKEREESESEREHEQKKKTPAAAGQRRIAKRRQAGRAQSIAAPLLAAAAASQEADDDRPSSSAPAALSASARARRASVAAPRRSDELDYSD